MNFTFGIVTSGGNENQLNLIIDSIEKQNIPKYEIIIVGNSNIVRDKTLVIPFNEEIRSMWITKKKNLILDQAKYENIVFMHDYIFLCDGWYSGFLKFGNNFDICMNKILNYDSTRFRDWVLWPHNDSELDLIVAKNRECLLPYDINHLSEFMYISGAYWVVKTDVMNKFPLDETLLWGQGEDVIWSKQVRKHYSFSMNPFSSVQLFKYKDPVFNETTQETIEILKNYPVKISINYFSHTREKFWEYFQITSYFLNKIKPENKKYIKLNILSTLDYEWNKILPKGIQTNVIKFEENSINYMQKVNFAINQPQEYSVKLDEDCFFSNHVWDFIIENIDFLNDEKRLIITPLLSNNIPLVDDFIETFIDDQNIKLQLYELFKSQVFPNNLWGVNYSSLNESEIYDIFWDAEHFYQKVDKLDTQFKGIHPIRINADSQIILNNYIIENFSKLLNNNNFEISEFIKPYFTTSVFIIKTKDWKSICEEKEYDAFDEVQLNNYRKKNNLKLYFIKNGFGMHTIYNTIYENKNIWNIGMENGYKYEENLVSKIKEIIKI